MRRLKSEYLVIDKKVLPEIFEKVIEVKRLLKGGKVKEITEATKTVGISRSVYYKYKDYVFEFSETSQGKKFTFNMIISHKKGILSSILNFLSEKGGNILTINQGIPINNSANLSITMDVSSLGEDIWNILEEISSLEGVQKVEFVAME